LSHTPPALESFFYPYIIFTRHTSAFLKYSTPKITGTPMFKIYQRKNAVLGTGAHACNPSYLGDRDQEDCGWKSDTGK
jgi:hypothetical protein